MFTMNCLKNHFFSVGKMSETLALDLTVYLSKETEWLPWETFVSHIDNVLMLFSYSEHYANMKVNSYSIYLVYDTIHLHVANISSWQKPWLR